MNERKSEQTRALALAVAAIVMQAAGLLLPMVFSWSWNVPLTVLLGCGICAAVVAVQEPDSAWLIFCGIVTALCGVLPVFFGAFSCGAVLCLLLSVLCCIMIFDLDHAQFPFRFVLTFAVIALGIQAGITIIAAGAYTTAASKEYYAAATDASRELEVLLQRVSHLALVLGMVLTAFSLQQRSTMPVSRAWRERPLQPGRMPYSRDKAPQQPGGWYCPCGRHNAAYTSTCVCGKSKREAAGCKPPAAVWRCSCGRENPNYTSTCVCGKNKREIHPG